MVETETIVPEHTAMNSSCKMATCKTQCHMHLSSSSSSSSSSSLYIYLIPSSPPTTTQTHHLSPSSSSSSSSSISSFQETKKVRCDIGCGLVRSNIMHAPRRFKKAFMERLLLSLQVAGLTSKYMGLRERRDAVRLSSDVAMASARGRAAPWARALVARHATERRNEPLLRRIMGGDCYERAVAAGAGAAVAGGGRKEARSRRIVRRSQRVVCSSRRKRRSLLAILAARRMVKGRLRLLRRLVPGAEALRGFSLLSETLDYVVCLKTQVELMQSLCKGSQQQQHLQLG